jgi:hypothetical protein
MADVENTQPAAESAAPAKASDRPPERLVRHVFWKYPILSAVMFVVVVAVAFAVGSPNWPRDTIASVTKANPGGAILAFTQELDGTATSTSNAAEYGMGDPAQVFVLGPLRQVAPLWRADYRAALATYDAANPQQELAWAKAYDTALGTITPMSSGGMGGTSGPDYMKIGTLKGNFGPVPVIVQADLLLAQNGFLEQYLQAVDPGHSFHLVNIWLYDHPNLLNTAVAQGLTDDQWGMVKERGFPVGPWYLFIPAVFHVELPGGATGQGFVLWNLLFAAILLFVVPLVPGVRDIPKYLKLYRFIYRYPLSGELEKPALAERHGATHGEVEVAAGGGE